ncbi:MAG: hypothetical protein MHM6MM_002904 [Cercozoa sp. M6MM]
MQRRLIGDASEDELSVRQPRVPVSVVRVPVYTSVTWETASPDTEHSRHSSRHDHSGSDTDDTDEHETGDTQKHLHGMPLVVAEPFLSLPIGNESSDVIIGVPVPTPDEIALIESRKRHRERLDEEETKRIELQLQEWQRHDRARYNEWFGLDAAGNYVEPPSPPPPRTTHCATTCAWPCSLILALALPVGINSHGRSMEARGRSGKISAPLYSLIARQLRDDGFGELAQQLCTETSVSLDDKLGNRKLQSIVDSGKAAQEKERLERDAVQFPSMKVNYSSSFKKSARAVAFSADGKLCAAGGGDGVVRVFDVNRMHLLNASRRSQSEVSRCVRKTVSGSSSLVRAVAFQPRGTLMATASDDCAVRLYDIAAAGRTRRPDATLPEYHKMRCLSFHPTGEWLLAGGAHAFLRLYDTETMQSYSPRSMSSQHTKDVNDVTVSRQGDLWVTAGEDGDVRIWDGANCQSTTTLPRAHGGTPAISVRLSSDSRMLVTAGLDDRALTWDMRKLDSPVHEFTGARRRSRGVAAVFSHDERFVLSACERTGDVHVWHAQLGHSAKVIKTSGSRINDIACSPNELVFLLACNDGKSRFYAPAESAGAASSGQMVDHD